MKRWNPQSWLLLLKILRALVSAEHSYDASGSTTLWDCSNFKIIVLRVIQGIYLQLYLLK